MDYLGEIARLQVQISSLKLGDKPRRWYDPAALHSLPALRLEPHGVGDEGGTLLDVHNALHPASKYRGENGVSIGFTGHYARMRAYFGRHVEDGIAGENILVRCERTVGEEDLARGVVIVTVGGEEASLSAIEVAEPCAEFSRYALRYAIDAPSSRAVTEALRFLRGGMRGFYATYAGPAVTVRQGDRVFLP